MIEIDIPGFQKLKLHHLLLDYNGTIAKDGQLISGVADLFDQIAPKLNIHVITADTFGAAREQLKDLPCEVAILPPGEQDQNKRNYAETLGLQHTVCIGNGRNDRLMVQEAILGIAIIQSEAAAVATVVNADVVIFSILDALELLLHPKRLVATMRS